VPVPHHLIGRALVAALTLGPPAGWSRPGPGPVVRGFAAPVTARGPGHRGIDLAADPGSPVRAVDAGVVVFAGAVGGTLQVVLRHPDGSRSGYAFLASVSVPVGARVGRAAVLGRAGGTGPGHPTPGVVHLSWREGSTYRDPRRRLAPRSWHLVPASTARPGAIRGGAATLPAVLGAVPGLSHARRSDGRRPPGGAGTGGSTQPTEGMEPWLSSR
jgi:murein DD-endopeptidase MepM/ murein hydrolase activator NlpD